VLRGIFTLRRSELEWFYQEGCSWIFPEAFEDYLRPIPPAERGDLIAAYYLRLTDPDPDVQLKAARAWSAWEGSTLRLLPDPKVVADFEEPHKALALARIHAEQRDYAGALEVMERDARTMRGERPFVFTNLKTGHGLKDVERFIESEGMLVSKT